ncbi:uncharacterized protein LOC124461461 [Drosophila willistoni]|uniref:uncharacterized protein LOC124461461 n=1 Tax=Drosophila willistoni TaxID=7260 RepID=UPI001F080B55|nr:uncharacterized protein LOC124461461 [Drosophila willistoni]
MYVCTGMVEKKCKYTNQVNIDDEELLDQVIKGIPDKSFCTQARIQCFTSPRQMLKAFAGVHLDQQTTKNINTGTRRHELRCRNCNIKGHLWKDCNKTIRARPRCVIRLIRPDQPGAAAQMMTTTQAKAAFIQPITTTIIVPRRSPNSIIKNKFLPVEAEIS